MANRLKLYFKEVKVDEKYAVSLIKMLWLMKRSETSLLTMETYEGLNNTAVKWSYTYNGRVFFF